MKKELMLMCKIKCLDRFNAPLPLLQEREKEGEAVTAHKSYSTIPESKNPIHIGFYCAAIPAHISLHLKHKQSLALM
jgi:hypothetical protein